MTNNTTLQRLFFIAKAVVTGGNVLAQAGGSVTHTETGGTFTANGATPVTVTEPAVTANSAIVITLKTVGGTPAAFVISDITAGTGFEFTGTAGDTSDYNYLVIG